MALFKRGEVWWYEFIFAGRRIRESAKTSRKTIAIQAERGRRLELEKTLAGLPVEKQENRINSVTGVVRKYLAHYEINHRAKSVLSPSGDWPTLLQDLTEDAVRGYHQDPAGGEDIGPYDQHGSGRVEPRGGAPMVYLVAEGPQARRAQGCRHCTLARTRAAAA